jgi:hypothetical protein
MEKSDGSCFGKFRLLRELKIRGLKQAARGPHVAHQMQLVRPANTSKNAKSIMFDQI